MKRVYAFFESFFGAFERISNLSAVYPILLVTCVILLTATLFFVPKPDALTQKAISPFVTAIVLLLYSILFPFPSKKEKTSKEAGAIPPVIAFFVRLAGIIFAIIGIDSIMRHFSELAYTTLDTMCYVVIAIYAASCLLEAGLRMLRERGKVPQKKEELRTV